MKSRSIISSFCAAAVEVAEGLFNNVKAFASLVGTNPAIQNIVGKIKQFIVIPDVKNDHRGHVPTLHGASLGFAL